jgi:hypothetical protein
VVQVCEPVEVPAGISGQAISVAEIMNKRVGEFVFDLQLEGRARRYLGPDVLGGGFSWRDGVLTARGLWPGFGYNFTSFSILLHPRKQVTGGKFFTANREVCTIVGLAIPEEEGFPAFTGALSAGEFSGTLYEIAPDGTELGRKQWIVDSGQWAVDSGKSFSYGSLTETEAVAAPGQTVSALEVADGDFCAGIRKWMKDEKLEKVEVYVLSNA